MPAPPVVPRETHFPSTSPSAACSVFEDRPNRTQYAHPSRRVRARCRASHVSNGVLPGGLSSGDSQSTPRSSASALNELLQREKSSSAAVRGVEGRRVAHRDASSPGNIRAGLAARSGAGSAPLPRGCSSREERRPRSDAGAPLLAARIALCLPLPTLPAIADATSPLAARVRVWEARAVAALLFSAATPPRDARGSWLREKGECCARTEPVSVARRSTSVGSAQRDQCHRCVPARP